MIKFFRHIRQTLIMENKTGSAGHVSRSGKYFKYAIGEIILVMIGILLALQVNNWNEKRIEKQKLTTYYESMHEELVSSREYLTRFTSIISELVQLNKKSLEIINLKNKDSLFLLKETLGALGTSYTNSFNFPIVEEFISEGNLAKVKNLKIKDEIQAFSIQLTTFSSFDTYINNQYSTSIEPYFYNRINYAQVAKDKNLVIGGPETDYQQFYNNLEFYNIVTFKLETLIDHHNVLLSFTSLIERLTNSLASELKITPND